MINFRNSLLLILSGILLSACGGEKHQELRDWMREQEKGMRGRIDPLPRVRPYEPLSYEAGSKVDPFNPIRIKGQVTGTPGLDIGRPREPLEEFPLETIRLVGIFQDKSRLIGQVMVNGRSHQVRVGNYIGQNFGKVVRIVTAKNEERIVIKELMRDADDQFVERESELLLDNRGVQ